MPNRQKFTKYGRWDTPEAALNGLDVRTNRHAKDIAKARHELYKIEKKRKESLNG